MLGNRQLDRCLKRKEKLLRDSAANRGLLAEDAEKLRRAAAWVDAGLEVAQKAKMVWDVAAPLLALRRARAHSSPSLAQQVADGVSLVPSLLALWKSWQRMSH